MRESMREMREYNRESMRESEFVSVCMSEIFDYFEVLIYRKLNCVSYFSHCVFIIGWKNCFRCRKEWRNKANDSRI